MLGGLFGALGSAISGAFNYFGGQQTNAQNMLMNTGAWKAQQVSDEAKALGVSPLAILGNTGQNIPMQPVQVPDFGSMGQNIGRAAGAFADRDEKMMALKEQELRLRNLSLQNDVVAGQLRNSVNARVLAAPGSGPTSSAGLEGSPYYGPPNPFGSPHPTLQRNADGTISRSKEQAEVAFSGDPVMMAQGAYDSVIRGIGLGDPFGGPGFAGRMGLGPFIRGDVFRSLNNPPPLPGPYDYGGW